MENAIRKAAHDLIKAEKKVQAQEFKIETIESSYRLNLAKKKLQKLEEERDELFEVWVKSTGYEFEALTSDRIEALITENGIKINDQFSWILGNGDWC